MDASAGCRTSTDSARLLVPWKHQNEYNGGQLTSVVMAASSCVRKGSVPVFFYSDLGTKEDARIIDDTNGTATVTDIQTAVNSQRATEIGSASSSGLDSIGQFFKQIFAWGNQSDQQERILVRFTANQPANLISFGEAPKEITFAQQVTAQELDRYLSLGASLIDTREAKSFALHHHPQAVNIPYRVLLADKFAIKGPGLSRFAIDQVKLPSTTPLILMGESKFDYSPVHALLEAYNRGWHKLIWFRGGETERLGVPDDTSEAYPNIKTLTAEETLEFIRQKKGGVIDVRTTYSYNGGHLPMAISVPYLETSIAKRLPADMSRNNFKQDGDSFELKSVGQPGDSILVYAAGHPDFRGIKAAIWLREMGWKNVYWFRQGIFGWLAHARKDKDLYHIEK